jgi:ATP-dependent RNA helicase DeaD
VSDETTPESPTTFADLGLSPEVLGALEALGYEEPTPIQVEAIPPLLEGRDVIGRAATGTGKTAAFSLPMVERLDPKRRAVQALVIAPTRELAVQVAEAIHSYGKPKGVTVLPVYGGQPIERQLGALRRGVDVVVGTPGRLLDHIRRGSLDLGAVDYVVLDEADEMLDMGFIEDIEAILTETPGQRQTALFSATFPPRIAELAERHMRDPLRVTVRQEVRETPLVRQLAYIVARPYKLDALARVLDVEAPTSAIIFCGRRTEVDELTEALGIRGYHPEALHGGLTQAQRDRVMSRFREGVADLLIATDVAARGLDIEHVSHVVNYDVPQSTEAYVHRIGRTGRAGREGTAITIAQPREQRMLKTIEREVGRRIEIAPVPTLADLRARRTELVRGALRDAVAADDYGGYRGAIEALVEEFAVIDLAAAALKLAADAMFPSEPEGAGDIPQWEPRGHERFDDRERRGPRGARERSEGTRGGRRGRESAADMTRLYIGIGKRRGIRPGDIVGAIAGEARIPGGAIGAIEIADQFTLVDVPESYADQVIRALSRASIRGRPVAVRRAREE